MNKNTAIGLIQDTFMAKFDEARFTRFANELLNDLEPKTNAYSGNLIWEDFRDQIVSYKRIGKYVDPEGNALDVLIVQVATVTQLERARTTLRNFVIKHLRNFEKDYALVAFYSKEDGGADWRFSFVKLEYKAYFDEAKGKVKSKKEFTPAKRYSFLVGEYEKTHTAQNQILPLLQNVAHNPTVADLEGAFSIEKVTDEFFAQYKDLYIKLSEHFEHDEHIASELKTAKINVARFTKKLLGQIVFLYFLQKKGWLGVKLGAKWGTGNKRFMQQLFEDAHMRGENFFKDKLQYLFYEALAKERNNQDSYYPRLNCRIPFLNGGLFEAEYDWQQAEISIPAILFRNEEKNSSGDIGTGVLDVFDRYNFTIKEDEPLDKEVAVDPEMLGKVFENMLEITERKSKGAFYTPREIVHYMCQESLIQYLDKALNDEPTANQPIDTDQLRIFGGLPDKKGKPKLEFEHKGGKLVPRNEIEDFVREGHFALENDQRTAIKGESRTYQFQLPESIRTNAELIDRKLSVIRICDPAIGSGAFPVGLLHELVTAMLVLKPHFSSAYLKKKLAKLGFLNNETDATESRYVYRLKRHIIQECIYGVDKDASATDIARLRLWLCLVVDEDDLDPIETLPNLDYKIVCGDSLVGFPRNWDSPNFQKVEDLKKTFYDTTDHEEKSLLKNQIDSEIGLRLESSKRVFGYHVDFDFRLFFSEVWQEKGGFDIVIGNPPYVDIKKLPKDLVRFLFNEYDSTENRINLYSSFIEKGLRLCGAKGSLIFINPNSMLLNSSYKKLRELIIDNLLQVIKLPDNIFKEAIVETIIIHIGAGKCPENVLAAFYKNDATINFDRLVFKEFRRSAWKLDTEMRISIFSDPRQLALLIRIENNRRPLIDLFDLCLGITPYDAYKGHTADQIRNRDFHAATRLNDTYVPLISGANIHRFYVDGRQIREYLSYGAWLGAPRQRKFFTAPRVIVRQIVSASPMRIYAGYTEEEVYHTQIGFAILRKEASRISTKTLCAYLNSDVLNFFHNFKFLDIEKKTFQKILIENCKSFPIEMSMEIWQKVIELVVDYNYFLGFNGENLVCNSFFDELNNAIFYDIFFGEELQSANKQILPHLVNMAQITDTMQHEEKLAIIQSEFERLYNPNHPVRYAIETLDSIEEVRIIKEALK